METDAEIDDEASTNVPGDTITESGATDGDRNSGTPAQKRVVVEKMPSQMSYIRNELEYTKARNRDLRKVALEERERNKAAANFVHEAKSMIETLQREQAALKAALSQQVEAQQQMRDYMKHYNERRDAEVSQMMAGLNAELEQTRAALKDSHTRLESHEFRRKAEQGRALAINNARWEQRLKGMKSSSHPNTSFSPELSMSLSKKEPSPSSSEQISRYLEDLGNSKRSGAPMLSIGPAREKSRETQSSSGESDDASSILNAVMDESITNSDDSTFDPSCLQLRARRFQGRQKAKSGGNDEDIGVVIQQLKSNALEDERRRRGRKSRINQDVKTIKRVEDSDVRLQILDLCRQVFKDAFDVERDDDFLNYDSVDSENMVVAELDKTNLCLDMSKGSDSDWNAAVLRVLVKRVEMAHRHARLPQRPHEYFQDVVREKFDRARVQWKKGQRRITNNDVLETQEELVTRIAQGKDRELVGARDRERKASKFKRRMDTVEATIERKKQEAAADTHVWQYLQSMLVVLGKESMSSDESDYDQGIGTYFRPKIMPWRRKITWELDMIDKEHRRLGMTERRRGAKPVVRRRDGENNSSLRDPVPGLPISLYDQDWLKGKSVEYVKRTLRPAVSGFKWRKVTGV